jgi:L-seryl-tRNA(Ser) seleniumtransferase
MAVTNRSKMQEIPKVDRILGWPEICALLAKYPRPEVLVAVRTILEQLREQVRCNGEDVLLEPERICAQVAAALASRSKPSLRTVINGSGVVVHTNLGRSPLADEAEGAIHAVSVGYSNLEFDLETGERGTRNAHVEGLICEMTGAEAALVVNNNAAAVILALSSLAQGREVIISRGELVEIGGSFRIPDVMRQSGAKMVEVGTTNRTHLRDFTNAITDATALLLKVHTSNFAIMGFTADASIAEMALLGCETGLPVMLDAGSGCLIDLSPFGIFGEPTVRQHLSAGADVVTFSGDKLLGGPQAGLIAGKRQYIEPMKRHPLLRALRMDKLNLASLEATLRLYRDERRALAAIPTLCMLTMTAEQLARRAVSILRKHRRTLPGTVTLVRHPGESSAGGGSFPLLQLPTTLIEVRIDGFTPQQIEAELRRASTPVIGRIHRDRFLLDVRTLMDRDLPALVQSISEACDALARGKS